MEHYHDDNGNGSHAAHTAGGFLAGVVLGGLIGAGAALLMAPQSGKKTRARLQEASLELRDQTVAGVEDAMDQARTTSRQISAGMHKQAEDLQQRGQALFDEQKERVAVIVEAGKKVAKGSSN